MILDTTQHEYVLKRQPVEVSLPSYYVYKIDNGRWGVFHAWLYGGNFWSGYKTLQESKEWAVFYWKQDWIRFLGQYE